MKATCVNCGTDSEGDTCPICHKYDDSDYVMDDSRPPRVIALEAQNAEMLAMLKRCKELAARNECFATEMDIENLIEKVEGENGK